MIPPKTRSEMEHNFFLALEDFKQRIDSGDKDLIANALWATAKHIKRVKKAPNNRVDVSTINQNMRLQANMKNWMDL